jgi:hypothetical protein
MSSGRWMILVPPKFAKEIWGNLRTSYCKMVFCRPFKVGHGMLLYVTIVTIVGTQWQHQFHTCLVALRSLRLPKIVCVNTYRWGNRVTWRILDEGSSPVASVAHNGPTQNKDCISHKFVSCAQFARFWAHGIWWSRNYLNSKQPFALFLWSSKMLQTLGDPCSSDSSGLRSSAIWRKFESARVQASKDEGTGWESDTGRTSPWWPVSILLEVLHDGNRPGAAHIACDTTACGYQQIPCFIINFISIIIG